MVTGTTETDMTNELETEATEMLVLPRSKVKAAYKLKYAEREAAMQRRPKGLSRRVLARCNGDWLAIELARLVLGEKDKLDLVAFTSVLEANGIKNKWVHLNPGQQRMCGGLALRHTVAEDEELVLPDGSTIKPPRAWVAKHQR